MLIKVVNPNTTAAMTAMIGECARLAVGRPGTVVEAVNPLAGPPSIESHYDEAMCVPGLLAEVARGEAEGAAGHVVACFGDPGVDAARELARGPVVGIAEAAMHAASYLGRGFSVVTTLGRTRGRAWELVGRYGMREVCRNVRACEVSVLDLETDPSAPGRVLAECRAALAEDDAEVIVLGCAGMADLCRSLSADLGVPVINGVSAAVSLVEGLAAIGLTTSTRGDYAPPPPKAYTGGPGPFRLF